jgi:hypothetical protein
MIAIGYFLNEATIPLRDSFLMRQFDALTFFIVILILYRKPYNSWSGCKEANWSESYRVCKRREVAIANHGLAGLYFGQSIWVMRPTFNCCLG